MTRHKWRIYPRILQRIHYEWASSLPINIWSNMDTPDSLEPTKPNKWYEKTSHYLSIPILSCVRRDIKIQTLTIALHCWKEKKLWGNLYRPPPCRTKACGAEREAHRKMHQWKETTMGILGKISVRGLRNRKLAWNLRFLLTKPLITNGCFHVYNAADIATERLLWSQPLYTKMSLKIEI